MNHDQLVQVFARIQAGDNRRGGDVALMEWWDTIGDLDHDDAIAAVAEHRRTSTEYLLPAHVRRIVARMRQERSEKAHHEALASSARPAFPSVPREITDALMNAWNDRVAYVVAEGRYNTWLESVGQEPLRNTWKGLPPIGHGV